MDSEENKERPLDCSACTRKLTTKYTEVNGKIVNQYYMCKECPFLEEFLSKPKILSDQEALSHLTCGNCNTSLLEIQRGEPLGCTDCYEVFEVYLISLLKEEQRLQLNLEQPGSLHLGHKPGEFKEMGESLQIFALNETLNEMIHREDFEQAASIRDQIKELKKKQKKHD